MSNRFKTIAMDPPWLERGGGKSKRGADRHYPLMSKKDIHKTITNAVEWNPDRGGSHLWMWATSNFLPDALWLMQVLGFDYKTNAVWVKTKSDADVVDCDCEFCAVVDASADDVESQIGLGQYLRHAHEWLLLGTMGKAMVPEPADRMPSVIFAPRTKHSKKPQEAYDLIERCSPGPRLEMFAREPREGWQVFGNEV